MNLEIISRIPETGHTHIRRHPKGVVEHIGLVAVQVNLTGVLQARIDAFTGWVTEISLQGGVRCSDTDLPFVARDTPAFNVAHGIEHLAHQYEIRDFSAGWGVTRERSVRAGILTGDFWIELHEFEPKPLVLFPTRKIPGYIMRAIRDANLFLQRE